MKKKLSITPQKRELIWGAVYIALELIVLPFLLAEINYAFGNPLSATDMNVVFFVLNFAITTLIFRNFIKRTLADALHHFPDILRGLLQGFLIQWVGNILVTMLVLHLDPDFVNVNDAAIGDMVQQDFLPLAVCTVFLVPVAEELLFRGVLFAGFYNRGRWMAFLFSTVVFCAIHVYGYVLDYSWETLLLCFLQYIPASIALGWAYAKSGSILSPLLIHIIINAIGILAMA